MISQPWPRAEMRRIFLITAAALWLPGCVSNLWSQEPAPVTTYGAQSGVGSAGAHTVSGDDTLWNISNRYNISMQDLVYANKLSAPYQLREGMRLLLPPPQTYKVREEDSLYTISRLFNISTTALARLNSLSAPYNIKPGQTLRLPAVTPPEPAMPPPAATMMAAAPDSYGAPVYAPSASITAEPLAPPPGQGQRLGTLPAPTYQSAQTGYLPNYPQQAAPPAQNMDGAWMPQWLREGQSPESVMPPQPQAELQVASLPPVAQSTAPRTDGRFEWPVVGRILSGYGPKPGGEHNDGINISVPAGTPVRAAEDGTVVYADNELKGFGNLLLIRHKDRWMTAYGHLDRMAVKSGDKVRRGQTIGTVGSTGSVDKPQLHFEVRRGTEALNPEIYMARIGS